jgi:ABC-type nickel/cobalt efflux system permease component RcnA
LQAEKMIYRGEHEEKTGEERAENGMDTKRPHHSLLVFFSVLSALCVVNSLSAHPVPRRNHDRTISVRLTADALIVDYRLELDAWTVVFVDLPAVMDRTELAGLSPPEGFYQAFMDRYAPILGSNLLAKVDRGEPLSFRCVRHQQQFRDERGQPLDHLRFDFRFEAPWPAGASGRHELEFEEGNFQLEEGLIALTLQAQEPIEVSNKTEPQEALRVSQTRDLGPGDDHKRRRVSATWVSADRPSAPPEAAEPATATEQPPPSGLQTLLDSHRGLWALLAIAAGLGAAHALTPGHGKTLVAAYLIGERGTVWHAVVLGLATTVTHTGTVIALAGGLLVLYPNAVPEQLQMGLGLGGGLLIAGLGTWLLLRRLAGEADHIHLAGHHHHHHDRHHHHHDHHHQSEHDPDNPARLHPATREVNGGLRGLILLGISGGIIPCWDAILMFGFAVSTRRLWLALPLLLAFSAGLASVLIATGILVVRLKGLAASRWENSRLIRGLPVISALLVTLMGLWLCYDSIHPHV